MSYRNGEPCAKCAEREQATPRGPMSKATRIGLVTGGGLVVAVAMVFGADVAFEHGFKAGAGALGMAALFVGSCAVTYAAVEAEKKR